MSDHLGAALQRGARLFPTNAAVVDGDTRWTFGDLDARVGGFDAALDGLGLKAGDVVAVLAHNSAAHLVCWLAIPRSGRVLNDLNTRLAPAELEFILGDSDARALIVDDTFLEAGRALADACETVEHLIYAGTGATPEGLLSFEELSQTPPIAPRAPEPDTLAGIFYTGGTTGLPKGAMLTHRNLVANAKHALLTLGYVEGDIYLHAAPMFHLADGASTYALTWVGGTHVIIPTFAPELWAQTVAAEHVTHALLVPTMINMILNTEAAMSQDLSSLRKMLYGASPMPQELLRLAMEKLPCGFNQAYGMTEISPLGTFLSSADHERGATGEEPYAGRLASAGRPVVGVEVEVHREDGSLADVDEIGEVWLRGPNVMAGYWRREAETAAALDAEGWYHSGDAGRMDAGGYLFIVDRVKDMIISGGENVYSTEVENAIFSHPAVLECAVFGVPDERWGESVHAAIVLKPGASATAEEIIEHCRALIAGYKLPRGIDIHEQALPKSGAGKLLKRDLRAPYWEGRDRQVS